VVDYVGTLYHVGVRVVDLEAAMAELGAALGITWASVVEREQQAWTPADGAFTTPLRFTYCAKVRNTSSCYRERPDRCGTVPTRRGCTITGSGSTMWGRRRSASSQRVGHWRWRRSLRTRGMAR